MPRTRRSTLTTLAAALAAGDIDLGPSADWVDARERLSARSGIGPWTVEVIAMRALGDPDAFPGSDLGVVDAARRLGLVSKHMALAASAEPWRPWRAYAVQHLWATGRHPINRRPA
jgi:AraC family transcriptional regulator of adaptative response / DNA-3-methyladenine glycosylase II